MSVAVSAILLTRLAHRLLRYRRKEERIILIEVLLGVLGGITAVEDAGNERIRETDQSRVDAVSAPRSVVDDANDLLGDSEPSKGHGLLCDVSDEKFLVSVGDVEVLVADALEGLARASAVRGSERATLFRSWRTVGRVDALEAVVDEPGVGAS